MSKVPILMRMNAIIKRLKKSPLSFKDLNDALKRDGEIYGYRLAMSYKTFQRDIHDIRSLYHIDIVYNHTKNVYEIKDGLESSLNDRILEAFDTLQALNASIGYGDYLDFEREGIWGSKILTDYCIV